MAQLELKIGDKTYNKAWVDNLSSTSQISTDPAGINYGVIPSTGNATMRDINGQIRADIENGVLPVSNAQTKVVINGNQIQEHLYAATLFICGRWIRCISARNTFFRKLWWYSD